MNLIDSIKKTNGDILGLFLFLILILYFTNKEIKTNFEIFLLFSCIIAFIVDVTISYKTLTK
jgi:predicted cation transporter